jgi:hypothetical protein
VGKEERIGWEGWREAGGEGRERGREKEGVFPPPEEREDRSLPTADRGEAEGPQVHVERCEQRRRRRRRRRGVRKDALSLLLRLGGPEVRVWCVRNGV